MDLQMPGGGLSATERIAAELPDVRVLVLTMFDDDDSVFAALRAGARGYVLKDSEAEDLVRAVRAAAAGEAIFGRSIAQRLLTHFSEPPAGKVSPSLITGLTPSEHNVLRLMARGLNNPAIARELSYSDKTVRNYVSSIFRKLQVESRSEAIVRARDAGWHDSGR
jgi:DNA-binding NarL/FixJ family response regulator